MWILSSFQLDWLCIYLPGLLGLALGALWPDLDEKSLVYGLLAGALIDSGHVYTTFLRTWLNPSERRSSKRYIVVPVIIFVFFSTWYLLKIPGLWMFVVYATLYHHLRQVYGYSKWYQLKNKRFDRVSDRYLYALALWPLVIYHFREQVLTAYYTPMDILHYPHHQLWFISLAGYLLTLLAWLFYEHSLYRQGIKELNRFLSVAYPALMFGCCFIFGKTTTQVLIPLLLMHGLSYMAVMVQSLKRTRSSYSSFKKSLIAVTLVSIVFGPIESWLETTFLSSYYFPYQEQVVIGIMIGFYLVPLFSHYAFDAWIWRRNHREAYAVFEDPAK